MESERRVLVVGAGPAGLTVAAALKAKGVGVTLLDRAEAVGSSWRNRYEGLRLNTVRWFSGLPGLGIPRRMGRWVGRDDFVDYLEAFAAHHRLKLKSNVQVDRISRGPGGNGRWQVSTSKGTLEAFSVVLATGAFDIPVTPAWPGWSGYRGEHVHAASYRRPEPYSGRSVLVIGAGATGLEIAAQLADGRARTVYLSVRSCQNLFPRELWKFPLTPLPVTQRFPEALLNGAGAMIHRAIGKDWPMPLPPARERLGTALRKSGREPVVADGVVEHLRAGRIRLVPPTADFGEKEVYLEDGRTLQPDAVIAATGYKNGLAPLVGHLGVLRPDGSPLTPDGGPIASAPGLAFVGFEPTVTGRLLQMPAQARRAARVAVN